MSNQEPVENKAEYVIIDVSKITPNPDNPRTVDTKSESFKELAESVRASGVLVPVHVRSYVPDKGLYGLLAGERRLRACIEVGRDTIPAINHGAISEEDAFEITFAENFCREDMTVFEQSKAVEVLLEKYNGDVKAVASKLGKSVCWVMQRRAIKSKLSKSWREAIKEEPVLKNWTAAHLQLIASLPPDVQDNLLDDYKYDDQTPSVAAVEKDIAGKMRLLKLARWDIKDDSLLEKVPACSRCSKRTSRQPGLFDDTLDAEKVKANDRCLDAACWDRKEREFLKKQAADLRKQYPNLVIASTKNLGYYEERELKEVFGQVNEPNKLTASKEGAKGAVPALVIAGEGVGEVKWVKPKQTSAGKSAKIKGVPKTLAEKRKELESKRWFSVLREMVELVEESPVEMIQADDKVRFVMTAAATFGTETQYGGFADAAKWKEFEKNLSSYLRLLWEAVRPVLAGRIEYNGPITQVPKGKVSEAKIIAKHLGIDIDAMFKKQIEAIPEPKAWAKQKEAEKAQKAEAKKTSSKKSQKNVA